jgi:hypothetical protein
MVRQILHRDTEKPVQPGWLKEDRKRIERATHHEFNAPMCLEADYDTTERRSADAARACMNFESIAENELDHWRGTRRYRVDDRRRALQPHLTLTKKAHVRAKRR